MLLKVEFPSRFNVRSWPFPESDPSTERLLLNVHAPVTVSFCDKEAGPPGPQSNDRRASRLERSRLNCASLKEILEKFAKAPVKPSRSPMAAPPLPMLSTPHEKVPVTEFHKSF